MSRPPDQSIAALISDLDHLRRIHKRAEANTKRSPQARQAMLYHFSHLIRMYTDETTPVESFEPEPVMEPAPKRRAASPNGKRKSA